MTENVTARPLSHGPPALLELRPAGTGPRRLDGVWWPRSAALGREVPALVAALEERWPGITRVTVIGGRWRDRPTSVLVGGREVHISRRRASLGPPTVCLLSYGVGRCDLLCFLPGGGRGASHAGGPAVPGGG